MDLIAALGKVVVGAGFAEGWQMPPASLPEEGIKHQNDVNEAVDSDTVGLTAREKELHTKGLSLEAPAYRCTGRKYSQIHFHGVASRHG